MGHFLFVDTETTGKLIKNAPVEHELQPNLVQIAALLTDDKGKELNSLSLIVKPENWTIGKEVEAIHGISMELAMNVGVSRMHAMALFHQLATNAQTIVAHNLAFDKVIINIAYHRIGKISPIPNMQEECTMLGSKNILKLPGRYGDFKWPSLMESYEHFFNKKFDGAHNALIDVQACRDVFFAMKEKQ